MCIITSFHNSIKIYMSIQYIQQIKQSRQNTQKYYLILVHNVDVATPAKEQVGMNVHRTLLIQSINASENWADTKYEELILRMSVCFRNNFRV
jgi:hypothetical protein